MKKIYTMLLAGACALGVSAERTVSAIPYIAPELQLKNVQFTEGRAESKKIIKAEEAEGEIPASIVGKSYISFYNDGDIDCNGIIEVAEGENGGVVLKGFAYGYDVNGNYDAATGKLTIPINVVIGTHSTYGDITLYALVSDTEIMTSGYVTGTVRGNTIEFSLGFYGKVQAGALIIMKDVSAKEANAKADFKLSTDAISLPLLVNKTAENKVDVVGMSNLMYSAYCPMEFTLNETAKTATFPFGTTVDKQYTQTGYVNWVCGGFNSSNYLDDLVVNVTTTDDASVLKVDKLFWGYLKSGQQYSGYTFTNVELTVDFNVFTAAVEGGEPEDPTAPTISGITYLLSEEEGTAQVTGCDDSLTNLAIPETITLGDKTYTVTSVAENAFLNNKTVTSITIPETMKSVAKDAFRNMSGLQTLYTEDLAAWCGIEFENGLANPIYNLCSNSNETKWGKFLVTNVNDANTADFTNLTIPEGVTTMTRSFYGYKALKSVTLPSTLTTLGDQTFSSCNGLTEVVVPEGVTTIGSAFFSCENLKSVTLPSTLETLGNNAFYENKALEEIELPAGLKTIGLMAFYSCSGLKKITSNAEEPAEAKLLAFDGVAADIPVYVPAASIEAYKAAAEWKDFTNYLAIPGSAVVELDADNAADVEYFNLQGVKVANPENGVFIRRQGDKVSKVVVK